MLKTTVIWEERIKGLSMFLSAVAIKPKLVMIFDDTLDSCILYSVIYCNVGGRGVLLGKNIVMCHDEYLSVSVCLCEVMDIKEYNLKNIPVPVGKMSFQEKTLSCPFVGFF